MKRWHLWERAENPVVIEQPSKQLTTLDVIGNCIQQTYEAIQELSAQQIDETAPLEEQVAFHAQATGLLHFLSLLECAQEQVQQ